MEEFKNFLNHYQYLIQNGDYTNINIKYDKGKLVLTSKSENCNIKRIFECSKQTYTKIIDLFYSLLIQENKLLYSSIGNNTLTLKSEFVTLKSEIVNEDNKKIAQKLVEETFDKIKTKNIGAKKDINSHENIKNYIINFLDFLKTNEHKKNIKVFVFFKDDKFHVLIKEENQIIYESNITCSKQMAKDLTEIIFQQFIDNNNIISSSYGPARYTCFSKEYNCKYTDQMLTIKSEDAALMTIYDNDLNKFHELALQKMNSITIKPAYVKIKSSVK